jgi:hypothetical protein
VSLHGFVYLLRNPAMPFYYKIGRTINSPYQRAAALSSGTGVPEPFKVVCFAEFEDCRAIERQLHDFLYDFRPNHNREFFQFRTEHLPWVIGLFKYHPRAVYSEVWKREYIKVDPPINPWQDLEDDEPRMTEYAPVNFVEAEAV